MLMHALSIDAMTLGLPQHSQDSNFMHIYIYLDKDVKNITKSYFNVKV